MALASAFYGFLGLLLSFRLARQYVDQWCALLATMTIWCASSLPVYMYFNPSWSHASSAFAVALFLWYWHETRASRTTFQWLVLGTCAGLMLNVYYPNTMILTVLLVEAIHEYSIGIPTRPADVHRFLRLLADHLLFAVVTAICFLPTLLAHRIIYGNAFESGYVPLRDWLWRSPVFLLVLFSSDHGLFTWTPVLAVSVTGLVLFLRRAPVIGTYFLAGSVAFYVFISCYPDWDGISSYGNRFFVSLTLFFVFGLAVFLDSLQQRFAGRRAFLTVACTVLTVFALWNAGLMFQWGSHLVPARGPISLREMAYNQFFVVPRQITGRLQVYLFRRRKLMQQIEEEDIRQKSQQP